MCPCGSNYLFQILSNSVLFVSIFFRNFIFPTCYVDGVSTILLYKGISFVSSRCSSARKFQFGILSFVSNENIPVSKYFWEALVLNGMFYKYLGDHDDPHLPFSLKFMKCHDFGERKLNNLQLSAQCFWIKISLSIILPIIQKYRVHSSFLLTYIIYDFMPFEWQNSTKLEI